MYWIPFGLVSVSYGQWEGVEGGGVCRLIDEAHFRYIQLQFEQDRLVGANTLGMTQHVGRSSGIDPGTGATGGTGNSV